jgi:hypothetical protein
MNSHGDIVGTYTFADNVSHIFVMSLVAIVAQIEDGG